MSKANLGYVVYGVLFTAWLVFELVSVLWKGCPWPTLSSTVWNLERRQSLIAVAIAGGLFVLTLHLAFRWPNW